MTSVVRSIGQVKEALTRFIKPESPCYQSDTGFFRLFPFTYSNGTLDITYEGNNFESVMVTTTGVAPPDSEIDTYVRVTSGPYLVTRLGENFKAYVRAWRDGTIDAGSPIEIYVAPQVFRVQEADASNISIEDQSYLVSTSPPAGDNYIAGDASNDYRKACVFKTPLTFTIVESGVTKYITFRTIMDQE